MIPGTWYFNFNKKPDWTISKSNAQYYVRGDVQKRHSPEPLNSCYPVVHWGTVMLMFIFQFVIGLQSQIIDFKNDFSQADIPSGEPFFIDFPRYFKSEGGQCDVVFRLNKSMYGQVEAARLWYEKLQNYLLERSFVMSKLNP